VGGSGRAASVLAAAIALSCCQSFTNKFQLRLNQKALSVLLLFCALLLLLLLLLRLLYSVMLYSVMRAN
jgi:hypothetical protein